MKLQHLILGHLGIACNMTGARLTLSGVFWESEYSMIGKS